MEDDELFASVTETADQIVAACDDDAMLVLFHRLYAQLAGERNVDVFCALAALVGDWCESIPGMSKDLALLVFIRLARRSMDDEPTH